jgi:hypothetical protein
VLLPAHPAPGSAAIVRRRRSLQCHSSSPKGRAALDAHPRDPRRACSATPEPDERTADALCHASIPARRSVPVRRRRGPILSRCANTTRF